MDKTDLTAFFWINQPKKFQITNGQLIIDTDPNTDLWQKTHYGFQNDNAPGFLIKTEGDFTFSVKAAFQYKKQYDQCGIWLYENEKTWMKASMEYENESFARLGSVVTSFGYSDWATSDVSSTISELHYRLSRRGLDFLIEYSKNGTDFQQMRIFHFHPNIAEVKVGIYACSPKDSSFRAIFSAINVKPCLWNIHS
jgi:regulation of enolase protein 1 (concanavalin A-like superfamily)